MAKTALELTVQEWQQYRPDERISRLAQQRGTAKRWSQAWRVARKAGVLLRRQYGASKVVVFGSLAHRAWFTPWSDIDLAAWGIPAERFYSAVAAVTALSPMFKVDLLDPDTAQPGLRQALEQEGIEL